MMTKIGAIWARISTPEQASLESQITRAKAELEGKGYVVPSERILAVDWGSLDLFSCPEFQRLIGWVQHREIQALGILDRDRLEANGLQRLQFLADCRDAGVELTICQGPPILNEEEGQLVELALTIGKKRSVMRAKQGAKDGLHDRAVERRLPTSHHKVFGYKWDGKTPEELKLSRRLVPNENWDAVKLILDLVLKGVTYCQIVRELGSRGILSPTGNPKWDPSTISSTIARNPIYAGRYYALSKEVVEPKKRTGKGKKTHGNSSARTIPLDQRVYLPEVEILDPPITWKQYLQIQERVKRNQELAQRNAKHDYLLRGFIFCETHYGKKGEPRRYHGQPYQTSWRYACPVGGCAHPYLNNGPEIENQAKLHAKFLINLGPDEFYERISDRHNRAEQERSLQRELSTLETKCNRNINAETELEGRNLLGQEHPEVYRRLKAKFQAERIWIEEREQVISEEQAQLDRLAEAAASLQQIRAEVKDRLHQLSKAEWRELFIALNLEIHIRDRSNPATWHYDWLEDDQKPVLSGMPAKQCGDIEICFGLPLREERAGDIVFSRAGAVKHNIYPIRFPLSNFIPETTGWNKIAQDGVLQ